MRARLRTPSSVSPLICIPYIFKASYDKANRTSVRSFRGPGLIEGARILRAIAKDNSLPVLTDVHTPEDCLRLSKALGDIEAVLQIPAFLCRQTDLLIAAAHTGRAINIKKGQFVAPQDMQHAVLKVRDAATARADHKPARVFLTERGASFGYNNLVVDMRSLPTCATLRLWCLTQPTRFRLRRPGTVSAAASPSLFLCWRAPRWPRVSTASSSKFTTIRPTPNPTAPTRSTLTS